MGLLDRLRRRREKARRKRIDDVCRGWSGKSHWKFFHEVFTELPIHDVCIAGVYLGRDIAYIRDALERARRDDVKIVGVDLFDDVPGADWEESQRDLTWEEAGFGEPPSLEAARANLAKLGFDRGVELHQSSAVDFLRARPESFDLVYIDISHDYESTRDAIQAAMTAVRPTGFLCGDDYSDEGTWGVKRGVLEAFEKPRVFDDWIWLAEASTYKG